MPRRSLARLYKDEFSGYSPAKFQQDLLAGLTVAAVALPLALAFGVASGATAAAGLVTAILAGLVMGLLGGAPYQISGPTGAMSAVLIVLVGRYGLEGIWMAGLLSGALLLVIGLLRLGRFIAFIPSAVISGFTSGIALIIFIGQIDNFLGVKTPAADTAAQKLLGYFHGGFTPDLHALTIGLVVILTMLLWPTKWNARFPASLLGLILATLLSSTLGWPAQTIGDIPQTLFLADRLSLSHIPWTNLPDFIAPTLTITALGAVESLLCGAVGSNMTGVRLQANQELVAQGIGNMIIPFFGGVPATAAIARSSVGIKSGGQTRLVSVVHAVGLLLSMFLLAPFMAKIPLAALAGVLMVTAARMNEWPAIKFIFGKRFKTDMIAFTITMLATIVLDLTQAILIGSFLAGAVFLNKIASIDIDVQEVNREKLRQRGIETAGKCRHVRVAFLTGPLFFAATGQFNEAFQNLGDTHALILSMRGVPLIDPAGLEAIHRLDERLEKQGGVLMFAGVHNNTYNMMKRGGLVEHIGEENFFWSSDQAIVEAEKRGCRFC
ncbi:MAG: sulfate permease [Anaerolineaceae bacterium]|nr:SulP family inorganic anion transporter [Anaerolineae bacterium]MBL1172639.1 SulP family inorganic anion transporter [Chloroflexota bacterium]MCE7905369.1 SulP family inorganic anion transporter [Anaerolineae bacterium CFX3]MDL1927115.1 SulP family inorganic anion transporter [Anaerolineae bacterium AMX1]WKZ54762.1 MAG: SulP family inorganic anion transporter [Anaerolineales bacterium]GJQ38443.1 MAG: sulfate permease [Anaerolineaceae bacterium]